ncbi:Predicted arabinose efflux permease, MFS family [Seinonella peptonophila]|uniref:Predicted arabinose efflux permease, MFS family n=1 Tax=Seinonella peptonophila TaxID=112248 RepID=A0A1M4VIC5_9BACL|nr:MFS transporter [Seinonella peptonophila]SHE68612.1 Predicted arabinose efflux permease, MFS family [Seinonella peptonophila]
MKSEVSTNHASLSTEQPLMQNQRFLLLWFASICSAFAFPMYVLAEQWYVVKALHASYLLGWVMMATALPRVIFMLLGGVFADQWSNSKMMAVTSLCRSILLIGMLGLLFFHSLNFSWLFVFAILFGLLDAFFWPASESIIPHLVSNEQIVRANSILQTTQQLSLIIAPIIGGWIIYKFQFVGIFIACALLLLISSGFAFRIQEDEKEVHEKNNLRMELLEGYRYIKNSPFLLGLLAILIVVNFFISGPISMGIPLIVDQLLHGDSLALSYLRSAFGMGSLLGAILVGILNIRSKRGPLLFSILLLIGFFILLLGEINWLWQGMILLLLIGVGSILINIPLVSMIQEGTETSKMGRVMSLVMTISIGLMPLSYALCSSLLSSGMTIGYLLVGASCLVILFTCFAIWKFREVRQLD